MGFPSVPVSRSQTFAQTVCKAYLWVPPAASTRQEQGEVRTAWHRYFAVVGKLGPSDERLLGFGFLHLTRYSASSATVMKYSVTQQ